MEGRREGEKVEQDGGDEAPDEGALARLVDDADPGDGTRQDVGAGDEDEEEHKHDAREFVAEATPHQADGIGVVLDVRVLQAHLPDQPAGVDGDEADAHGKDDAGHHAQTREGAGHAQGAQRDGLNDEADSQPFPSQLAVLELSFGDGRAPSRNSRPLLFVQRPILLVLLFLFARVPLRTLAIAVGGSVGRHCDVWVVGEYEERGELE